MTPRRRPRSWKLDNTTLPKNRPELFDLLLKAGFDPHDAWPNDLRLSDLEPRFIRQRCGKRGADVRPDFNWDRKQVSVMGYR